MVSVGGDIRSIQWGGITVQLKPILVAVAATLFVACAGAEDAPANRIVRVFQADVEPNSQAAYEAVIKRFAAAHKQLGTKFYFQASTEEFGSPTTYTFARFFPNFAAMDEPPRNVLVEAFGQAEADKILATIAGKVRSQSNAFWVERLDLSTASPDPSSAPPLLVNWLFVTVKPYKNADYEQYLMKVKEATQKVAPTAGYTAYSPGANAGNVYAFAVPAASWAALDAQQPSVPERLTQAFGAAEAKRLLDMRATLVAAQSDVTARPRPDLSNMP